jgi:hypothetical protein
MKGRGMIEVNQTRDGDPMCFEVAVTDGDVTMRHEVTLSASEYERLARGIAPDGFVEAAFRFLLDREPKESILSRFDVKVIGSYFPEFEEKLPDYLSLY